MSKEEIVEKINEFLVEEFEVEESSLSPDANLKDALELDSLDFVDLVVIIDETFDVKLVGKDFEGVTTLQDFYNLIEHKILTEQ